MKVLLLFVAGLLVLGAPAHAGVVSVEALGSVAYTDVTTGPYAGVDVGGRAQMVFDAGQFSLNVLEAHPRQGTAVLQMVVPERAQVTLAMFNISGRKVRTLFDGDLDPGEHDIAVSSDGLPGGVYFARMAAGDFAQTRRVVFLK
jgi:hypothetical protein